MLIFEITKTDTPLPQKDLTAILIAPPHTYLCIPGNDLFCETKKKQCYSPFEHKQSNIGVQSQAFPLLEFSPALESLSDIYTCRTSCLNVTPCLHRTRHDKSPTVNCCCVLFMTYWHKFQMIFNGRFREQCRQVLAVAARCGVRCTHGVSLLLFHSRFPLLFFYPPSLSFCRRSANVRHVHWVLSPHIMSRHAPYCWLDTSLFWYWARLSFLKHFWKKYIPHL